MRYDSGGLEILDLAECRRLLAGAPLGRIVFTHAALPAVQPVTFVLHDGDVTICTAPGSRLAAATRGAIVAFEADEYDPRTRTGWSVVMVGPARRVTDPRRRAELRDLGLESWDPERGDEFVRIVPEIVTGRRIPGLAEESSAS